MKVKDMLSPNPDSARAVAVDAFEAMPEDEQMFLRETADALIEAYDRKDDMPLAYSMCLLDSEEQLAVWSLLPSYVRRAIKGG